MNYPLTDEERAVVEQIKRFSAEVLAPQASRLDEESLFATLHLPAMAEIGMLGLNMPENMGGIGLSGPALYAAVEAIAGACGSTASMLTAHFLATDSLLLGGDTTLQARILPDAAAGETLGAFALTEPQAGSNPHSPSSLHKLRLPPFNFLKRFAYLCACVIQGVSCTNFGDTNG